MFVTQAQGTSAYQAFGNRAATEILDRIAILPASHRDKNLKAVLNTIDPSLYKRAKSITQRYRASGMPPGQAAKAGLSRAMATGIAAEVVKLGQRRAAAVPKKGLLGLGAYGKMSALSGVALKSTAGQILSGNFTGNLTPNATGPQDGNCDPTGQFIWKGGGWTRRTAASVCTGTYDATITSGGSQGGVTITDTATGAVQATNTGGVAPANTLQMMQVGPFTVPLGAELTIHWTGLLPQDWIDFVSQELAHDCSNCIITSMEPSTPGHTLGALRDFLGEATPTMSNKDLVAVGPKAGSVKTDGTQIVAVSMVYNWPDQPLAQVVRPDNGEKWGFFLNIVQRDLSKPWDSTTNPYVAVIGWRKCPSGVWDWIKTLVGTVIDWVGDALSAIGDAACQLLSSPAGQVGAVAAGSVIGGVEAGPKGAQVGAQAGAVGAQIAQAACGTTQVCPAGTVGNYPNCIPLRTTPSWLMPVAIGGAGILLVLAVTGKKKKKKASPHP